MKRFINVKSCGNVETVDELDSKDFSTEKEFKTKLALLVSSHSMVCRSGKVYTSQRKSANW